jgi:hypothetical protein
MEENLYDSWTTWRWHSQLVVQHLRFVPHSFSYTPCRETANGASVEELVAASINRSFPIPLRSLMVPSSLNVD